MSKDSKAPLKDTYHSVVLPAIAWQADNQVLLSKLEEKQNQEAKLLTNLQELQNTVRQLEYKIQEKNLNMNTKTSDFGERISKANRRKRELVEKSSATKQSILSELNPLQLAISDTESRLSGIDIFISIKKPQVCELNEQLANLEEQCKSNNSIVSSLETKLAKTEAYCLTLKTQLTELTEQKSKLKKNQDNYQKETENLAEKIKTQSTEIKKFQLKIASLQEEIEILKNKHLSLQKELAQNKKKFQQFKQQLSKGYSQRDSLKQKNKNLQLELEAQISLYQSVLKASEIRDTSPMDDLAKHLKDFHVDNQTVKAELKDQIIKNQSLRTDMERQQEKNKELEIRLKALKSAAAMKDKSQIQGTPEVKIEMNDHKKENQDLMRESNIPKRSDPDSVESNQQQLEPDSTLHLPNSDRPREYLYPTSLGLMLLCANNSYSFYQIMKAESGSQLVTSLESKTLKDADAQKKLLKIYKNMWNSEITAISSMLYRPISNNKPTVEQTEKIVHLLKHVFFSFHAFRMFLTSYQNKGKNEDVVFTFLEMAANPNLLVEKPVPHAPYMLGHFYEFGNSFFNKSRKKALKYYKLAAESKFPDAEQAVNRLSRSK